MTTRRKFSKRPSQFVVAVQLNLETAALTYEKWGSTQRCKPGDWIVDNNGDTYTVDRDTFTRTYLSSGSGTYVKITPVWAEVAQGTGEVHTKEGTRRYGAGDYLVFNEASGGDPYVVSKLEFERMYEPADS
jgi:hypothetical protein